ncbi:LOW QUALITY PROTEIN: hypothetical protein ACHAW6_006498, partial [Cyclotella cf. meneghiniana]
MQLWDKLLPQAELTINLLDSPMPHQQSPPMHILTGFLTTTKCRSPRWDVIAQEIQLTGIWAFHSVDGWYLNTSPDHYHTHKCHIKSANSEQFSDTVEFPHKRITNPTISPADKIMKAISSCMEAINGRSDFKTNHDLLQLHFVLHEAHSNPAVLNKLLLCRQQQQHTTFPRGDNQNPPLPRVQNKTTRPEHTTRSSTQHTSANVPSNNTNLCLQVPTIPTCLPPRLANPSRRKRWRATDFSAALIANELLEKRLNKAGYFQLKYVPGLWAHTTQPIAFTLVVDDFGVKYVGKEHALHLKSVLEAHYKCSADWAGTRHIGITLNWDYANRKVHLSMPGYKTKALRQFQHHKPSTPQHSPF